MKLSELLKNVEVLNSLGETAHTYALQRRVHPVPVPVMDKVPCQRVARLHKKRLTAVRSAENDPVGAERVSLHEGLDHERSHGMSQKKSPEAVPARKPCHSVDRLHVLPEGIHGPPLLHILRRRVEALSEGVQAPYVHAVSVHPLRERRIAQRVFVHTGHDRKIDLRVIGRPVPSLQSFPAFDPDFKLYCHIPFPFIMPQ